jgi:hypothetical protein
MTENGILDSIEAEIEEALEDADPLPTPEEAELGELCRTEEAPQFRNCELVDSETKSLIEALEEA